MADLRVALVVLRPGDAVGSRTSDLPSTRLELGRGRVRAVRRGAVAFQAGAAALHPVAGGAEGVWPERDLVLVDAADQPVAVLPSASWLPGVRYLAHTTSSDPAASARWVARLPAELASASGLAWEPRRPRRPPPGVPRLTPEDGTRLRGTVLGWLALAGGTAATLVLGSALESVPVLLVSGVLALLLVLLAARPRSVHIRRGPRLVWRTPGGPGGVLALAEDDPPYLLLDARDGTRSCLPLSGPTAVRRAVAVPGNDPAVVLQARPGVTLGVLSTAAWTDDDLRELTDRLSQAGIELRTGSGEQPRVLDVPATGQPGDAPASTGAGLAAVAVLGAGMASAAVPGRAVLVVTPFAAAAVLGVVYALAGALRPGARRR